MGYSRGKLAEQTTIQEELNNWPSTTWTFIQKTEWSRRLSTSWPVWTTYSIPPQKATTKSSTIQFLRLKWTHLKLHRKRCGKLLIHLLILISGEKHKSRNVYPGWWLTPKMLVLRKLQEDYPEFKASLEYTVSSRTAWLQTAWDSVSTNMGNSLHLWVLSG